MSEPKVSVIIPAYNCGPLVRQAAESVRRQTYQDFEVIIVDDGSTDDTWRIVEGIAADWPKVRPIRAEHKGLAAARNRAIAEMAGQWIALLDADDLWLPDKLRRCMDYLADHGDLRIVYSPMETVRMDGRPLEGHSKPCHAGRLTEKLFHSIFVHDPAAVFHKCVIEACGGFDESLPVCVGHEFWLRVSRKFEFGLIDEPLAVRRWHDKSLTRRDRARARITKSAVLERFYFERGGSELLADRNKARRRLARVHYGTGKILLQQRRCRQAEQYLAKAVRLAPTRLKAYPFYAACKLARVFGLGRDEPD